MVYINQRKADEDLKKKKMNRNQRKNSKPFWKQVNICMCEKKVCNRQVWEITCDSRRSCKYEESTIKN